MKDYPYLVVQTTFNQVEFALFDETSLLDVHAIEKHLANRQFLNALEAMLSHAGIGLHQLHYIAATVGPAPITTLRTLLATLNGIHFATQVPLIAIDGMAALLRAEKNKEGYTVGLVNAYNNDLFYGILDSEQQLINRGWGQATHILTTLQQYALHTTQIVIVGNPPSKELIEDAFACCKIVEHEQPPIEIVAEMSQEKLAQQEYVAQLLPQYVKELQYTPSIT